jgi:LPS O-antigen subunit length determinant protein (WzzB/FepE family)
MPTDTSLHELQEHAPPNPSPSAGKVGKNDEEISILDLLIVLAERKRTILWVTATFAVLAIVIALILPQSYTAIVVLLPPQQGSSMGSAIASQLGNLGGMAALAGGGLGLKSPNDMIVAELKSRTVEDAMVQHFGLMQEYHQRLLSDTR